MVEYAILIGVVLAAIVGMQAYAKRGLQAGIKTAADQIGSQAAGMAYEAGERRNRTVTAGMVLDRGSAAATQTDQSLQLGQVQGGGYQKTVTRDDASTTGALATCGTSPCGPGVSAYSRVVAETD